MIALYDGWPLIYRPNSPAARHLLTILAYTSAYLTSIVALPAAAPEWFLAAAGVPRLATKVNPWRRLSCQQVPTADTPWGRLWWQQRVLPGLARRNRADLLHLTSLTPPAFNRLPVLISPTGAKPAELAHQPTGWVTRLQRALATGGMANVRGIIWPADLPEPYDLAPLIPIPPAVHPDFGPYHQDEPESLEELGLPDTYVLYHGPSDMPHLQRLLEAWGWAAQPIGEACPLVVLGLDTPGRLSFNRLLAEYAWPTTVIVLPILSPLLLPGLYHRSAALFHPVELSPWGDSVRHAIGRGIPVVAANTSLADALTGPAAYLVPGDDARAAGAALIAVIGDENLAASLTQAAHQRAKPWDGTRFSDKLLEFYQKIAES